MFVKDRRLVWAALTPFFFSSITALPQATSSGALGFTTYDTAAAATSTVSVAANASAVESDAGVIQPTGSGKGVIELAVTAEAISTGVAGTLAPISTAAYGTYDSISLNSSISSDTSEQVQVSNNDVLGGSAAALYKAAFVPKSSALVPALSQSDTNGNSQWGLLNASAYGQSLPGPQQNGSPWGSATAENTNYYDVVPNTGVTRNYDFTVSRQTIAPDGVEKPSLLVNGAFPGPLIEANWGDWISVTLHNDLDDEGTSLHWHGLLQKETPYYDGKTWICHITDLIC